MLIFKARMNIVKLCTDALLTLFSVKIQKAAIEYDIQKILTAVVMGNIENKKFVGNTRTWMNKLRKRYESCTKAEFSACTNIAKASREVNWSVKKREELALKMKYTIIIFFQELISNSNTEEVLLRFVDSIISETPFLAEDLREEKIRTVQNITYGCSLLIENYKERENENKLPPLFRYSFYFKKRVENYKDYFEYIYPKILELVGVVREMSLNSSETTLDSLENSLSELK